MTKMMNRIWLPLAALLCLSACDSGLLAQLGVSDPTDLFETSVLPGAKENASGKEKLVVNKVEFAPDSKTFSVWTGVASDIGPYPLTDSTVVRIEVEEYEDGVKTARRVQPKLVKAWNTESDMVKELGVKILVLVDLTLPQDQVDEERAAVEEMRTVFNQDNLYVTFMPGVAGDKIMPVSDYVLQQYFVQDKSKKRLFRSILDKVRLLTDRKEPWTDAKELKLVVFSDGKVYDENDTPFDPDHFEMESRLMHADIPEDLGIFFVNFSRRTDAGEDADTANALVSLCESTGGVFLPDFSWTLLENSMMRSFSRAFDSNRFDFVNPDGKIYRGDDNQLKINFYSVKDNHLVASATAHIKKGSLYKPIVVNGDPFGTMLIAGITLGLLLLLLIYLFCQLLLPFLRYSWFRHKYVMRYTGAKMAVEGVEVHESCYLCKAPFEVGDEVVVKCEHTMHKSCWDESEYHCPEYGRHCKEGSHFYDANHLFDRRNATFYMDWLLMAVIASICAWIAFSAWTHLSDGTHVLQKLLPGISSTGVYESHLNQLPSYAFWIGFFLTLGISFLSFRKKNLKTWLGIVLRALVAGVGSSLLYLITSAICIALRLDSGVFLINLIPWTLSSYLIAFVSTYGTRVKLKRSIILVAAGVSVVSLYLWSYLYMYIGVDFRVLLLFSYIIYAVGMVLSIASSAPKSEHYFLNVQGPVKTLDVALYKWFRANPNAVVSIGKSVDCSLQLTWDLQGQVAPVHAEITLKKGVLRLKALEDGVTVAGEPLEVDKEVSLYHGTRFQIGDTVFTYQEKDL